MKKYIESLTEEQRLSFCRKQIANTIKSYKCKENAVNAEFNHNNGSFKRTAQNRGGRTTTLTAKATQTTQNYFRDIEDLKLIIKYL